MKLVLMNNEGKNIADWKIKRESQFPLEDDFDSIYLEENTVIPPTEILGDVVDAIQRAWKFNH